MADDGAENINKLETERLGLWLGFAKVFFGTAMVGIVAGVINWQIQDRELEENTRLEETRIENAYLSQFVTIALDKDLDKRVRAI